MIRERAISCSILIYALACDVCTGEFSGAPAFGCMPEIFDAGALVEGLLCVRERVSFCLHGTATHTGHVQVQVPGPTGWTSRSF